MAEKNGIFHIGNGLGGRKFRIALWAMLLSELNLALGLITPGVWQIVMLGILGLYGVANAVSKFASSRQPSNSFADGEWPRELR